MKLTHPCEGCGKPLKRRNQKRCYACHSRFERTRQRDLYDRKARAKTCLRCLRPFTPYKIVERKGHLSVIRLSRRKWSQATKRSEEHTSELQSHSDLVCRLLLEKKKITHNAQQ